MNELLIIIGVITIPAFISLFVILGSALNEDLLPGLPHEEKWYDKPITELFRGRRV